MCAAADAAFDRICRACTAWFKRQSPAADAKDCPRGASRPHRERAVVCGLGRAVCVFRCPAQSRPDADGPNCVRDPATLVIVRGGLPPQADASGRVTARLSAASYIHARR